MAIDSDNCNVFWSLSDKPITHFGSQYEAPEPEPVVKKSKKKKKRSKK